MMILPRDKVARPVDPRVASWKTNLLLGALFFLSALTVRTLPVTQWSLLADLLARYQSRRPSDKSRRFERGMRAVLSERLDEREINALFAQNLAHNLRRSVFVNAFRRRQGWDPTIVLAGRERLEAALASGRGAILWFDSFTHFTIVGKRAIADAGHAMWHLGFEGHGILNSPFGKRFVNPQVFEVELRYLAGRIAFDEGSRLAATRRMAEILAGNGIVSLTNNAYIGKSLLVRFGDTARLPVAQTPLHLAASRGAALLPVSVIEVEAYRRYEVTVGSDLAVSLTPDRPASVASMAEAYSKYLLPLVLANPTQWDGWTRLRPS